MSEGRYKVLVVARVTNLDQVTTLESSTLSFVEKRDAEEAYDRLNGEANGGVILHAFCAFNRE